jgi:hypothetical protein
MPRLTFPISADGLLVPVLVGLDAAELQALVDGGLPLPPPVSGMGLVDTGTTMTAITARMLAAVGAVPCGRASTTTASGPVVVSLYRVSLTLYDPARSPADALVFGSTTVTELAFDLPDADVLIGLDLIRALVFTVDGPAGQFALSL